MVVCKRRLPFVGVRYPSLDSRGLSLSPESDSRLAVTDKAGIEGPEVECD